MSFVLSLAVLSGIGLVPGEVIECAAIGTLIIHGAAAIVALYPRRATRVSCLIIFCVPFLPAGCEMVFRARRAYEWRYVLPADRFRDNLASPVPASVSNLRFVPLDESKRPDLMLRFDIAPADLDEILARQGFRRVSLDELLRHDDLFRDPSYLPIDGDDELFQARVAWGTVAVIKDQPAAHPRDLS
ncbi:MAG: hypothetical protein K2X82_28895 [Gemmataceae bacterium]|nr:hypothetical protein [Gemmataceae bacterium]